MVRTLSPQISGGTLADMVVLWRTGCRHCSSPLGYTVFLVSVRRFKETEPFPFQPVVQGLQMCQDSSEQFVDLNVVLHCQKVDTSTLGPRLTFWISGKKCQSSTAFLINPQGEGGSDFQVATLWYSKQHDLNKNKVETLNTGTHEVIYLICSEEPSTKH